MKVNLNKVSLVLVFVSWLTGAFTGPELFFLIQLKATILFISDKREREKNPELKEATKENIILQKLKH